MEEKHAKPGCSDVVEYERSRGEKHHHRGKSSEKLVDKDIVMANLRVLPGQIVLDAGCGNGYMSKELSRAVGDWGKVYALDPDETSIEELRGETAGTNIEVLAGDIIDVDEHLYMQLFENRTID